MSIHDAMGADLAGLGGILRCGECGTEDALTAYGISSYLRDGWPVCCGYTMTWVTTVGQPEPELEKGEQ